VLFRSIVVLGALLVLGIAGWIYGRWGNLAMSKKSRTISVTVAVIIVVFTMGFTLDSVDTFSVSGSGISQNDSEGIQWQVYSDSLVEDLKNQGKPVFIDFTAAWCLSCQVNEKIAFSSEDVQNEFENLGITAIKADWTSRDDNITRALAAFGRNSVPLYVYYPAGENSEPILLPEILSPGIVLDAFENANAQSISTKIE